MLIIFVLSGVVRRISSSIYIIHIAGERGREVIVLGFRSTTT